MAYDMLNRPDSVSWFVDGEAYSKLAYACDASGNITGYTDQDGAAYTLAYNDNNLVTSISGPGGKHIIFEYDAGLRRTDVYLGAKAPDYPSGAKIHLHCDYDAEERLARLRAMQQNNVLADFSYHYDPRDNRDSAAMAHYGLTIKYAFDPLNRLIRESWQLMEVYNDSIGAFLECEDFLAAIPVGMFPSVPSGGSPVQSKTYLATYEYDPAGTSATTCWRITGKRRAAIRWNCSATTFRAWASTPNGGAYSPTKRASWILPCGISPTRWAACTRSLMNRGLSNSSTSPTPTAKPSPRASSPSRTW